MENDVLYNRIMNVVHEEYGPPGGEGTKEIAITENGTVTEDVRSYAYAEITTAVPNSYTASDEGKVVSNGALVSQSSATYTANDTYDTTLIDEVTVNVSGGSGDLDEYIEGTLESYTNSTITSLRARAFYGATLKSVCLPNVTTMGAQAFGLSQLLQIGANDLPKLANSTSNSLFTDAPNLKILVLPSFGASTLSGGSYIFQNMKVLEAADFEVLKVTNAYMFNGNTKMNKLILRRTSSICTLANNNVFNGTPFASSGTGGTLYVPQALISSYQSDTEWSTILGYTNNSIVAIEGSQYENYYADGTPLPTT